MLFNEKHSVGLEISDRHVRAVEMLSTPNKSRLLNYGVEWVDFTRGNEGVVEAVKLVLSQMQVRKNTPVNISAFSKEVSLQWLNRPEVETQRDNNPSSKTSPLNRQKIKMDQFLHDDYALPGRRAFVKKSSVVRVETRRQVVEKYKNWIRDAGYNCGYVDVQPFSLLNCFLNSGPKLEMGKTVALINVGAEITHINIVRGNVLRFSKELLIVWRSILDLLPPGFDFDANNAETLKTIEQGPFVYRLWVKLSNALISAIAKSMLVYEEEQPFRVDEIYLCGKMAKCKNFDMFIRRTLDVKVKLWDPSDRIRFSRKKEHSRKFKNDAIASAVAIGLASHRAFSLNLSKEEKKIKLITTSQRKKPVKRIIALTAGVILALTAGFSLYFFGGRTNLFKPPFSPLDYVGMSRDRAEQVLGKPFFKDLSVASNYYDETWVFHSRSKAKNLILHFSKGKVIESFLE